VLILLLTLVVAEPNAEGAREPLVVRDSEQCRSCHPRHFNEWLGGVHAFTRRDFILPEGTHAPRDLQHATFEDRNCASCHGGNIDELLGQKPLPHPVRLGHSAERTITCTVCHQMTEPLEARAHSPENCDPRSPEERLSARSFHKNTKPLGELRRAEFCGPCHEVTAPNGLKVERTFSQFLESDYPQRRMDCTTCHMTSYGGTFVPGGAFREQVHRHDIIGTDIFANPVPAMGSQKERVAEFLSAAASMFVKVPEVVYVGESFEVEVEVVNSGTGHNFPAGFPGERRLWLSVDVRNSATIRTRYEGEPWHSGSHTIELHDRYLNEKDEEVAFWWQASRIEERSLRALERRKVRIEVVVSSIDRGEALDLSVRLQFQACSPSQLRQRGLESLIQEYPVFEIQRIESGPIPIRDLSNSTKTVRVPRDSTSIQEGLDRVEKGGTVLVDPGEYELPASLDFRGKNAAVISVGGRDVTTLQLSDGGNEASVVVFRSGETRAARLEGFTVRGGHGTVAANSDLAHGGAIYCRDASPTIRGNRLIQNNVTGNGGGAYFFDSEALLEDNEIEENRAGGDGGGIAIEGNSRVEVGGTLVFANRAIGRGGGIATLSGLVLATSLLQGNQSGRGGGLAVQALEGDEEVRVDEARIIGNAAPLGGGVALDECVARFERVVIAGNASRFGGGVYIKGDGRPEFINVTLTENRASSGGAFRIRGTATPVVRNSILFNNQPPEAVGELTYSLVEDETFARDTNIGGLPFFARPGNWVDCDSTEQPGCVPMRWTKKRPMEPLAYSWFVPGLYSLVSGSPAIDLGSPDSSADPDGTRRDAGAIHRDLPSRGFIRGDLDGDRAVTIKDITTLGGRLFGDPMLACEDVGDVDDDARLTPVDAYVLASFHFGRARGPALPFPECGVDPTLDDGLGCFEASSGCE
jgi:hypothetical protein